MKHKTLVIACNYQTFFIYLSATMNDRKDFVYIGSPDQLLGYNRDDHVLKIDGYDKEKFSASSYPMLRMKNQSDFSFESLKPRERKVST